MQSPVDSSTFDRGSPPGQPTASFGSRLQLAKVEGYDFLIDDSGALVKDASGNVIPTGLLSISFLERGGGRSKVPFVLPVAGNSAFIGSLPEIGAFCVVGFKQSEDPIIIGFIPPSIHGLVNARRTTPNLTPGELFLQSSTKDVDSEARENQFRGASVYFDRYGRIKVATEGYEMIMGYVLSNEYTADVSRELDPITGNPIFFREKMVGGVERRVDEQGNALFSVTRDLHKEVGGNATVTIAGTETRTIKGGFTYQDGAGNTFRTTRDGGILISANSGTMHFTSLGNVVEEFLANQSTIVGVSRSVVVTADDLLKVGGRRNVQITGLPGLVSDITTLLTGSKEYHAVAGGWLARASGPAGPQGNATLEAVFGRVLLGRGTASQAALLGNLWVSFMTSIMTALATHIHPSAVGPTGMSPTLSPAWTAPGGAISQLPTNLSTKVFLSES